MSKKILVLLGFFCIAVLPLGTNAQPALCQVSGTLVKPDGTPATNTNLTIVKVVKSGVLLTQTPVTVRSHATTGVVTFTVPRSSTAYIYANVVGLSANGTSGVGLSIPDSATANLEDLVSVSSVPSTGLTVKEEGTALSSLVGTVNFVGAGVTATQPSPGLATVTVSAAPIASQFVTLATDSTLSNERVLTGTANQITITDAGAGGNVTLSLPQSIATSSAVRFGTLQVNSGDLVTPFLGLAKFKVADGTKEFTVMDDAAGAFIGLTDGTTTVYSGAAVGQGFWGTYTNSPFSLRTFGSDRIWINGTGGNVGIGNTNPQATLDVTGTAKVSSSLGIGMTPTSALGVAGGAIQVTGSSTGGYPTTGEGFELSYDTDGQAGSPVSGSGTSVFQSYSRTSNAWRDAWIRGANIQFDVSATKLLKLVSGVIQIGSSGDVGLARSTTNTLEVNTGTAGALATLKASLFDGSCASCTNIPAGNLTGSIVGEIALARSGTTPGMVKFTKYNAGTVTPATGTSSWRIHSAENPSGSTEDQVLAFTYNTSWDATNGGWKTKDVATHAVRMGLESRYIHAGAPTKGVVEFNLDVDPSFASGTPNFTRRPFFFGYDMDNSRTQFIVGDSADSGSDYFSIGQSSNYSALFRLGRNLPVVFSSSNAIDSPSTDGKIIISPGPGFSASEHGAQISTGGTNGRNLNIDAGNDGSTTGYIYLGSNRTAGVAVGTVTPAAGLHVRTDIAFGGDTNYIKFATASLSAVRTITFPNVDGTVNLNSGTPSADQVAIYNSGASVTGNSGLTFTPASALLNVTMASSSGGVKVTRGSSQARLRLTGGSNELLQIGSDASVTTFQIGPTAFSAPELELTTSAMNVRVGPRPATAALVDLGTSALPFKYLFIAGDSGTPGTNNFKVTGTSTSGTRTKTLGDATDLLAGTLTGTAAPATTPNYVGQYFVDTNNKKLYVATGTSSSSDWTILN
ncbi:MAG TPA: hypothetical protein VEF04_04855 [Blastocatellia bacterium]|nr:hypothetical protein [Blastocatellia bacterium]